MKEHVESQSGRTFKNKKKSNSISYTYRIYSNSGQCQDQILKGCLFLKSISFPKSASNSKKYGIYYEIVSMHFLLNAHFIFNVFRDVY